MTVEELASKGERTRAVIVDAACDLFLRQGYSATSMRQIAQRAGIALGGIYNHFASKDEIFQALVIDKHPYLQIIPALQATSNETAEEYVKNVSRLVEERMGRNPEYIKLMFIELVEFNGRHFPKVLEKLLPQSYPFIERFTDPASGMRQDIPMLKIVRIFIGNILAFYTTAALLADAPALPGVSDMRLVDFMEVFLHGVLTAPPTSQP